MVKKHYCMFCLCYLIIVAAVGCDSTKDVDPHYLQLSITASPAAVLSGEYSLITATLINTKSTTTTTTTGTTGTTGTGSDPVSGYPVIFTISRNISGGTLTIVDNITNVSGIATAIYKSGSTAGMDIVQVSIDSGESASATILVNQSPNPTPTLTPKPTPTPTPTPTPKPTPTP